MPSPRPSLPCRHLVLIGLRAAGKTTLGERLAREFGMPAVDLDDRTRARLGAESVRAAFAAVGEAKFREAESEALAAAIDAAPSVLALGGGTPTAPGAEAILSRARAERRAVVVFLDPPLDLLARRLGADAGDRPSLTGRGVVEEIADVASRRRGLYLSLADIVVTEAVESDAEFQALAARARERLL
ncbi:MAG: shikimate kinase [Planctomycetota bacterium]